MFPVVGRRTFGIFSEYPVKEEFILIAALTGDLLDRQIGFPEQILRPVYTAHSDILFRRQTEDTAEIGGKFIFVQFGKYIQFRYREIPVQIRVYVIQDFGIFFISTGSIFLSGNLTGSLK